jgi:hypothetical protein
MRNRAWAACAGLLLLTQPASAQPAPPPATPPQSATPAPKPLALEPAHTEQVPPDRAEGILGGLVLGPDGKDVGRIIDVLVDSTGKPRAAVIDFGGFFGVGTRKIAVSWTNLNFAPASKAARISLDLTADQIKAAPEYHETSAAAVVTAKKPENPAKPATPPPTVVQK